MGLICLGGCLALLTIDFIFLGGFAWEREVMG